MCKKHPSVHLSSIGNHQIISLLFKLDDQKAKEVNKNLFSVLTKIRTIKTQTLDNTKKIIDQTLQLSNKLITYLEDLENQFSNVYKSIKMCKDIDFQYVENFMNACDFNESLIFNDIETIIKSLTNFYNIDPCINVAQAIFCDESSNSQLFALDLENHISYPLSLKDKKGRTPRLNINAGFSQCNVDKQTSCIISNSYAYLIDIKKKYFSPLPSISISSVLCGLVCIDECIYAFQGNNNNYKQSCKLKLKTMRWENISSLAIQNNSLGFQLSGSILMQKVPQNFSRLSLRPPNLDIQQEFSQKTPILEFPQKHLRFLQSPPMQEPLNDGELSIDKQGTASIIRNNIVIASYFLDGIYHYNETSDSYANIFRLNIYQSNYVMENWIVSNNGNLYENTGPALTDFIAYPNSTIISRLSVYGSFPYKGYIYFMSSNNLLMRINCKEKKIETIQYNSKI